MFKTRARSLIIHRLLVRVQQGASLLSLVLSGLGSSSPPNIEPNTKARCPQKTPEKRLKPRESGHENGHRYDQRLALCLGLGAESVAANVPGQLVSRGYKIQGSNHESPRGVGVGS